MTGTMQVIAALYTTLNVAGPNGAHMTASNLNATLALLTLAATLAAIALLLETRATGRRSTFKGPALPALRRQMSGPKSRRA